VAVKACGSAIFYDGTLKSNDQDNRDQDNQDHDRNTGVKTQAIDERAHDARILVLSMN
jgi:hypothetical protein